MSASGNGAPGILLAAALACAGVAAATSAPLQAVGTAAASPAVAVRAHAEGPPAGHTGGYGEPTCRACHTDEDLNPPGGRLSLEGWPQAYEPGRTYPLTVVLVSEEMGAAGFQLATRLPSGASAGTLAAEDERTTVVDSAGVSYAQHTRTGTEVADPARAAWSVRWTAPDSGTIRLHVTANSANGDDSPLGDYVYAETLETRSVRDRRP